MYYVASEHIARWKHGFGLLNWALAPILRKKGTTAAATIIDILRKVRKGACVCMFAEGVRSWDGLTAPISPTTGGLVKAARCGLVTYRISGGYFASPMWSTKNTRRGYVHGRPVNVYTAEQIAAAGKRLEEMFLQTEEYANAVLKQFNEACKDWGIEGKSLSVKSIVPADEDREFYEAYKKVWG